MAERRYTTVRLDSYAVEDADKLRAQMRALGAKSSRDELVRALLWGITGPQAAGIVSAYIMHVETRTEDGNP